MRKKRTRVGFGVCGLVCTIGGEWVNTARRVDDPREGNRAIAAAGAVCGSHRRVDPRNDGGCDAIGHGLDISLGTCGDLFGSVLGGGVHSRVWRS